MVYGAAITKTSHEENQNAQKDLFALLNTGPIKGEKSQKKNSLRLMF
jgi:hypothetical protein